MYSAVPPPQEDPPSTEGGGSEQKEGPPRGISEETWKKFQQLRERRIKCSKGSTEKRIKDLTKKVTKSVLDNLTTDEEVAVLRDQGVVVQRGKKHKQNSSSHQQERNKASKDYGKRWNELQQYFKPDQHASTCLPGRSDERAVPSAKNKMEKSLDAAIERKRFDTAEKLNERLMQHDFAIKVAQAVECRDYTKRKAVDDEKAKKRKRSKPHWGFEQKARWESKGNM